MSTPLFVLLAVLVFSQTARLDAQVLYGSIVGNIKDASEAPVPGVAVTITSRETGQSRESATNEAGLYSFPTVPTGTYELKVSKSGFATVTRTDVAVTINSVTRVDLALQVGAVNESVQVTAESAALQTDRSEVRSEVTSKVLQNLPVPPGRNYQQLFRTLPGFAPPGNAHSVPSNPARALTFNVNGTSRSSNNTRIDGASSYNVQLPWVAAYVPGLEAIETVNVVTNSFDAEQGLAGGAAVSVQTKSGTNDLHGSAFEYHTSQRLKAKPFFLPVTERKPKLVFNQFGGTVGGPIIRNKMFYFLSYEGNYNRESASRFGTVPTLAIRRGDMSASPRPVYDPNTGDNQGSNRTPFGNNQVPVSRFSGISQKIVNLTPVPNLDQLTNNYFAAAPFSFDRHTADTKINYNVSSKLTTFGRFGILHYDSYNRQMFGDALGGPPISAFGGNPGFGTGNTYSLTLAATYILSTNLILDAYYGYTRQDTDSQQARLDEKIGLDVLGIPGTNGKSRLKGGWPRFIIDNYTTLGVNEDFMPYFKRDPQYQYVANFNWTKGAHNVRFGFDLYRQHLNHAQEQLVAGAFHGGQGGFTFAGGPTSLRGGAAPNQFNSYGTFLLGLPTRVGKIDLVPEEYSVRSWLYSYYIRDRWNVTPRLTLSYGARWEYFPYPNRGAKGLERYDPDLGKMLVCGVGQVPKNCGVDVGSGMIAPRIGLAYRAGDSTVIRAGYGLTNDPFSITEPMRANFPTQLSLNLEGANAFVPVRTLEEGIPAIPVPNLGNGIIDVPVAFAVATAPKKVQRGYVQSWNLTVQRQLRYGFTGQIGYVATRQTRQLGFFDLNAGQAIGRGQAGRPLFARFGRTAATTQYYYPVGTGQYNGLQATMERRFSRGLQVQVNYTWSKAIGVTDNSENNPRVQALDYFNLNRSPTNYDRTQNLAATGIWELPFGRSRRWASKGGIASAALGGWQINTILSLMTGTPFSVTSSAASLDMPGSTQRADLIKPSVQKLGGVGRGASFFDPLAFAPVTQPRFGNAGYNLLRGPGLVNWDFGLFREFRINERWRVQFRGEAFNFSNTPHFANPGGDASAMTLNTDNTVRSLGGFSEITTTTSLAREGVDERQFRLGIRISF